VVQTCSKCGHILDEKTQSLVELKRVIERMKVVAAEIESCTGKDRTLWWKLQAEFTELMKRSDSLCGGPL
jgi:hypothetical protein